MPSDMFYLSFSFTIYLLLLFFFHQLYARSSLNETQTKASTFGYETNCK